jgi:nucleotide-binding universal stress UspA family protein
MYRSIVVGTDGSQTARMAVERAAELAQASGAELHLVSAYRSPTVMVTAPEVAVVVDQEEWRIAAQSDVERQLASVQAALGPTLTVATHALPHDPAKAICETAHAVEADLIVVGNKGMKGMRRILGSVPSSVVHHAPCDVLIVQTT